MSARAGIVVTGTEVLSGLISDRNGPWLSTRLRELGVDLAHVLVVGDRRSDMEAALRFMRDEGLAVIVTSGGLGPTADDLTAEVVGRFQGRAMVLDPALETRIAEILEPLLARWPDLDREAVARANRKQAVVPEGAEILAPVGTAPGLVVPPADDGSHPTRPVAVVLPGPPRELQAMWEPAVASASFRAAVGETAEFRWRIMRLFGIPESEIAATLEAIQAGGLDLSPLEITTCLRRGEIEIATRFTAAGDAAYAAFEREVSERHADTIFSTDGSTIDEQVAGLLAGHTVATAESCTGGLVAARLTERPGSSDYVLGGLVVYGNAAKIAQAGVPRELIERHGAVSREVADALADGARERLGAEYGVSTTGIAGPGGGTEEKPVGTVWVAAAGPGGARLTRGVQLPGSRADVRDRTGVLALHLLRRLLSGQRDQPREVPD